MSDALSWQFIQGLAAALAQITVANGYRTDSGSDVIVEPHQIEDGHGACIVIETAEDAQQVPEQTSRRKSQVDMPLTISVQVPVTFTDAHRRAHNAVADIRDAFRTWRTALVPNTTAPVLLASRVFPRAEGSNVIVGQVTARVGLIERVS